MTYTLFFDSEFTREFKKLDKSVRDEAEKKLLKLKENPKEVGKPLKYFSNLFELHVRMYRIFYIVEDKEIKVLVLAMEHKDETIKYLRNLNKEDIKERLSKLSNSND